MKYSQKKTEKFKNRVWQRGDKENIHATISQNRNVKHNSPENSFLCVFLIIICSVIHHNNFYDIPFFYFLYSFAKLYVSLTLFLNFISREPYYIHSLNIVIYSYWLVSFFICFSE